MADPAATRAKRVRPVPVPPPEIAELVACLGPHLAMVLIEERGGTRIHVPTPAGAKRSFLLGLLGEAPLQRLAAAMGNSILRLPLCKEWRARVYLHEGGRSQSEIARLVGCTENWVHKLAHTDWVPMPRTHKAMRTARTDARQLLLLDD